MNIVVWVGVLFNIDRWLWSGLRAPPREPPPVCVWTLPYDSARWPHECYGEGNIILDAIEDMNVSSRGNCADCNCVATADTIYRIECIWYWSSAPSKSLHDTNQRDHSYHNRHHIYALCSSSLIFNPVIKMSRMHRYLSAYLQGQLKTQSQSLTARAQLSFSRKSKVMNWLQKAVAGIDLFACMSIATTWWPSCLSLLERCAAKSSVTPMTQTRIVLIVVLVALVTFFCRNLPVVPVLIFLFFVFWQTQTLETRFEKKYKGVKIAIF